MQVHRKDGPAEPNANTETWSMSGSIRKSNIKQRYGGVYLMYHWSCSKEDLIKHRDEYKYFLEKTDKPYIKSILEFMIIDLDILIAESE
jgi:hypothetical protein